MYQKKHSVGTIRPYKWFRNIFILNKRRVSFVPISILITTVEFLGMNLERLSIVIYLLSVPPTPRGS